jgi:hypothetical protein
MAQKESFNNLIDICLAMEEDPDFAGNAQEMFRNLFLPWIHYSLLIQTH